MRLILQVPGILLAHLYELSSVDLGLGHVSDVKREVLRLEHVRGICYEQTSERFYKLRVMAHMNLSLADDLAVLLGKCNSSPHFFVVILNVLKAIAVIAEVVINHLDILSDSVSKVGFTDDLVSEVIQTHWPVWIARVVFHNQLFKVLSFLRDNVMLDPAEAAEQEESIQELYLGHVCESWHRGRLVSNSLLF